MGKVFVDEPSWKMETNNYSLFIPSEMKSVGLQP